ncbi:hypothetical protein LVJ94_35890 [Pendulispora rubella]|uniref:Outer membrane protein beta-barrel domain-containing protein n=1 Tax=Pendulispora rubella TaxID=2741070 RepID=A0ABZ2KUB9_9BACT
MRTSALRFPSLTASFVFTFALASAPKVAKADVTSWFALGGGFGLQRDGAADSFDRAGTFNASFGVGTSSNASVVVGGIARSVTYFSLGTDLGIAARITSGGFSRGDWGLAFDAGVAGRLWKDGDHGRTPLQAVVTLGMPWGPQLAVGAQFLSLAGNTGTAGGFVALEIDLLRLTVMRKGKTDSYWFNPSPAGGREQ